MDSLTETPPLEGVIIPPEGGPSELVLLKRDPQSIFLDETFIQALLAQIATRATSFKPDTTTEKGRKQIASMAYRVAQTKTYIDSIGKDLVADLKDLPKKVDAGRKLLRDRLDGLKDEVRQPLDEWEAEQRRQQQVLDGTRGIPAANTTSTADQLRATIQSLEAETWDIPGFAEVQAEVLTTLRGMLEARLKSESEAAELERLRTEKAERDQKDREEQIRKEAAEKATREAEARANAEREAAQRREAEAKLAQERAERQLEEERQQAAQREEQARQQAVERERREREAQERSNREAAEARERDKANRARVLNEALDTLKAAVPEMDERHAKAALLAIAQGQIKHTRIQF